MYVEYSQTNDLGNHGYKTMVEQIYKFHNLMFFIQKQMGGNSARGWVISGLSPVDPTHESCHTVKSWIFMSFLFSQISWTKNYDVTN